MTYLLFVQRGFKIALLARDSFSTLLAVGPVRRSSRCRCS